MQPVDSKNVPRLSHLSNMYNALISKILFKWTEETFKL